MSEEATVHDAGLLLKYNYNYILWNLLVMFLTVMLKDALLNLIK